MDITRLWNVADKYPSRPDCLVVLSYAVTSADSPTKPTEAIIESAYRMWKKYPDSYVIMSTGDNQKLGVSNSRVMKEYGIRLGIPENRIIEEDCSVNTAENLKFSGQIIKRKKFREVTLVLYDLHVRRTLKIAAKSGWMDFFWISATSDGSPAYGIKKFQTYSRFTILVYEMLAYLYNLIRGEI
jgi:uncharacterized SAM-binding protein YcdF (DUF218 family)